MNFVLFLFEIQQLVSHAVTINVLRVLAAPKSSPKLSLRCREKLTIDFCIAGSLAVVNISLLVEHNSGIGY